MQQDDICHGICQALFSKKSLLATKGGDTPTHGRLSLMKTPLPSLAGAVDGGAPANDDGRAHVDFPNAICSVSMCASEDARRGHRHSRLMGVGIALVRNQRPLAHPSIGLAQPKATLLREPHQPFARPVDELGNQTSCSRKCTESAMAV
jgi:hypothetical protein